MCRLFGFRSVLQSQVHRSLLSADNALSVQSQDHPDGWGVAYYVADIPHVMKRPVIAKEDSLFHRLSSQVASQTVLAHIRKATHGDISVLNCHPFQFGRWVFAHNGQVPRYDAIKDSLMALIAPEYQRYILGTTDSEVLFYLFLSELSQLADIHDNSIAIEAVAQAMQSTLEKVQQCVHPEPENDPLKMTLLLTNGTLMLALCWKTSLHFSTHKKRCLDRKTCPFLNHSCESPVDSGQVNHLLISSEALQGENVWATMESGQLIGVDQSMTLYRG